MKTKTLAKGPLQNVLPDGFDADQIADFFSNTAHITDHPAIKVLTSLAGRHEILEAAEETVLETDAGAKPDFGGSKGGGGKGKNKTTDAETTTEPSIEPDPAPEPTPEPSPTPSPSPTYSADYVSGLDTPDGFNIELTYQGTWTAAQKAMAELSAENISDIITGDIPDYNGIDDVRITLNMTTIDGSGGTFGIGGTNSVRSDSKLSATGYVKIDSADVGTAENYAVLDDLLFHEMLHALGFGTSWSAMGLIDNYNGDLRFNGENATNIYNSQYANIAGNDSLSLFGVPVETDGGSLSAGKHWDEQTFGNDIMSSTLNVSNHISDLSIAALEDMGYQTILSDSFMFT